MTDNSPTAPAASTSADSSSSTGARMLLSHNFALLEEEVHPLNREEFADVFSKGLQSTDGMDCAHIDNPHWIVAVSYDPKIYTPTEVGQYCADALATYRKEHNKKAFTVMALGGVKNTPSTNPLPSLQTGEWGVDIVETRDPEEFLEEINWATLSGSKPAEDIFRIDCAV
ncbi:MAG: DUF2656 family protein [Cyanobacteria bacterium J06623_4]